MFVLAAVLLWTSLFEVVLRTYHFFFPSFVFIESHYQRFRAEPGSVIYGKRVNSLGFFDDEFDLKKKKGIYRIAAIGERMSRN